MFEAKRVIPPLAAASVVLTGCGDSDVRAGAGGAGGAVTAEAIEDFCMKVVECYAEQTQAGCERSERAIIELYISSDCLPLWTSYLDCRSELSCAAFSQSGFEDCVAQVAEAFSEELFAECAGET